MQIKLEPWNVRTEANEDDATLKMAQLSSMMRPSRLILTEIVCDTSTVVGWEPLPLAPILCYST